MSMNRTELRIKMMKQGYPVPIFTAHEWNENKTIRNKPFDPTPLLKLWDKFWCQEGEVNKEARWPWQGKDARFK